MLTADPSSQTGWKVETAADYAAAAAVNETRPPDGIVMPEPAYDGDSTTGDAFRRLVRTIESREVAALLLTSQPANCRSDDTPFIDVAAEGVTKEEIRGRLSSTMRYHALVRGMDRELRNMRRLSERLNQSFNQWDEELRLAGRLQRDFLPNVDGVIGPAKFATLFRPASWVSGDIYDIYRVDEEHLAFYVADAVGHGVAASLLTMFIKKAIVSKRVSGERYELLSPAETMRGLNEALASQQLPNCQFVTACYCLLNTRTLELQCCRGGHPYPFLVEPDGALHEIKPAGGLLGLFPEEEFADECVALKPGHKLILYSDGLETAFHPDEERATEFTYYRKVLRDLCDLPPAEIISRLDAKLNDEHGSLEPRDDVTMLVMEIAPA